MKFYKVMSNQYEAFEAKQEGYLLCLEINRRQGASWNNYYESGRSEYKVVPKNWCLV